MLRTSIDLSASKNHVSDYRLLSLYTLPVIVTYFYNIFVVLYTLGGGDIGDDLRY